MTYYHFAVQAQWPYEPLSDREHCVELWARLRRRFSRCLACVFMPDHLHLIIETELPTVAQQALTIELRAFTRKISPGQNIWAPVSEPRLIPDVLHLQRSIRYVHLNPCREGLTRDPLDWEWSTHRDAVGAVSSAWLDMPALARIWKVKPVDFPRLFHKYVSSDPSVKVEGTALPAEVRPEIPPPLEVLARAVILATRSSLQARTKRSPARRRIVHLADKLGRAPRADLAQLLSVSERGVRWIASQARSRSDEAVLAAALRVIGDSRLLTVRGVVKTEVLELPLSGSSKALIGRKRG
jgi:REP element-mobilizing transposase RayT